LVLEEDVRSRPSPSDVSRAPPRNRTRVAPGARRAARDLCLLVGADSLSEEEQEAVVSAWARLVVQDAAADGGSFLGRVRRSDFGSEPVLSPPEALECSLCFALLHRPVATQCGHVFCRKCLERSLDHRPHCPLCRGDASNFLRESAWKSQVLFRECETLHAMVKACFAPELKERLATDPEERENGGLPTTATRTIPVFVCNLLLPTQPCPLHIFEPRYRLMVRRAVEDGSREFGMCAPVRMEDGSIGYAEYGTTAFIKDVQMLPDGRSVLDTVGARRFKVLERSEKDGYNVAKVEWIEDEEPDDELDAAFAADERTSARRSTRGAASSSPPSPASPRGGRLRDVHGLARVLADKVREMVGDQLEHLEAHVGHSLREMEGTPGDFSFWLATAVRVPSNLAYALLPMRSAWDRLQCLESFLAPRLDPRGPAQRRGAGGTMFTSSASARSEDEDEDEDEDGRDDEDESDRVSDELSQSSSVSEDEDESSDAEVDFDSADDDVEPPNVSAGEEPSPPSQAPRRGLGMCAIM